MTKSHHTHTLLVKFLNSGKKKTVPYDKDLTLHFNKLKKKTENNFGDSFTDSDEVISALNEHIK